MDHPKDHSLFGLGLPQGCDMIYLHVFFWKKIQLGRRQKGRSTFLKILTTEVGGHRRSSRRQKT